MTGIHILPDRASVSEANHEKPYKKPARVHNDGSRPIRLIISGSIMADGDRRLVDLNEASGEPAERRRRSHARCAAAIVFHRRYQARFALYTLSGLSAYVDKPDAGEDILDALIEEFLPEFGARGILVYGYVGCSFGSVHREIQAEYFPTARAFPVSSWRDRFRSDRPAARS
nr:hypothetical protein [uncultured Rhodopila sp.]